VSHHARRRGVKTLAALAALALTSLAACGSGDNAAEGAPQGEVAVWHIDVAAPPTSESESFTAMVERVGCANGETGEVLPPTIAEGPDEILVRFTVESLGEGDFTCPGNDRVPYDVELSEPIGDRALVDGTCRAIDLTPGNCFLDGLLWSADRGVISEEAEE